MRKLLLIFFLAALLGLCAEAQEKPAACPAVSVKNPGGFFDSKNIVTYVAVIRDGAGDLEPAYKWTVSGGWIIEGQGSKQVRIEIDPTGATHQVEVEVEGLPAGCINKAGEASRKNYRPVSPEAVNPSCPNISVIGPSSAIRAGERVVFTAPVLNNSYQAGYFWTVSDGQIVHGQGTPVIEVSSDAVKGGSITARVEVKNLPAKCPASAAETASIASGAGDSTEIDQYGKLTLRQEKQRLDEALREMKGSLKDAKLVIIKLYPKTVSARVRKKRAAALQNYLMTAHKIPKKNISIVSRGAGTGTDHTRIYLIPPHLKP